MPVCFTNSFCDLNSLLCLNLSMPLVAGQGGLGVQTPRTRNLDREIKKVVWLAVPRSGGAQYYHHSLAHTFLGLARGFMGGVSGGYLKTRNGVMWDFGWCVSNEIGLGFIRDLIIHFWPNRSCRVKKGWEWPRIFIYIELYIYINVNIYPTYMCIYICRLYCKWRPPT